MELGQQPHVCRIVRRMAIKQLCSRWEFLIEFLVSSELVELSLLGRANTNIVDVGALRLHLST
jgi:hypothetical protein